MLMLALPANAEPPVSGAIFTTNSTCTAVNLNLYALKTDVYLSGGPEHPNSASLPDGSYFVQVTDPSGASVLGTSVGSGNQTPFVVVNGAVQGCLQLFAIVFQTGGAQGFADTPNPGGEYKVWVSNDSTFANNSTKTDNFKVNENAAPVPSAISGEKFYDANVNGVKDSGEAGIQGWQVTLFAGANPQPTGLPLTTTTDVSGNYLFHDLGAGTYGVCEVIPSAAPTWVPTTHTVTDPITVPPDSNDNRFGNVCLGQGGGLTLGFWSNKNGQKLLTGSTTGATLSANFVTLLNGLNLRSANGNNFDLPSTNNYTPFRNWLLGATATNMAYMLSAQLATMELNVATLGVSGAGNVFAGTAPAGCSVTGLNATGFISITDLMTAANAQLAYGLTLSGNPARACQEFLKNALDSANNNKNFVQAQACDVNYSVTEPSCVPALP